MNGRGSRLIRKDSCFLFSAGSTKAGTLLLFDDRLVHVSSHAWWLGGAAGLLAAGALTGLSALSGGLGSGLGATITVRIAAHRAEKRAAQGGQGVLELPFTEINAVRRGKQGINSRVLEVHRTDGATFKFAVKFDKWASDLALVG